MSKIEKLKKNKTINYSNDKIKYFIQENNNSELVYYDEIISKIEHSKKKIQIASTSVISNKIIDSLYQMNNVNIYIILKSFNKAKITVDRFNSKKPALLREVESLENNFIIIDDTSYFFINPLIEERNIYIRFDEKYTKDLSFLFNYYFWDCARQEKLENYINTPMESPFPPIGIRELNYVNIKDNDLENCNKLFIPRDKRYLEILDKESEEKYFSDDIKTTIYQNENEYKIGNIIFKDENLTIDNRWVLKTNCLKDINIYKDIIPKIEDWNRPIKILDSKEVKVASIEADTIKDMDTTKPKEFRQEAYINSMTFYWEVTPPLKPNNAQKSQIYTQYEKLDKNFKERLGFLNNRLVDLKKESGLLSKWFSGTSRQADKNLKKVESYKQKELINLNSIDLDSFFTKEFKVFYENIIKDDSNFKDNRKKKEAQEKWENEKELKNKTLDKKIKELLENEKSLEILRVKSEEKKKIREKITEIEKLIKSLKKGKKDFKEEEKNLSTLKDNLSKIDNKEKEQSKLNKSIKNSKNDIDRLSNEIKDKYTNFKYIQKDNEMKNFSKSGNNLNAYKTFSLPKYSLPEVGTLYETNNSYFLEISTYEELNKANELSQRYTDKQNYKVVVGDNNE